MSSRIIIVANRLPVTITSEAGKLVAKRSVGGLATALAPMLKQYDTLWIGWTGMRRSLKQHELKELQLPERLIPVNLSAPLVRSYYDRAANGTIWPSLLHFSPLHPCNEQDWQALMEVTRLFAKAIQSVSRPDDIIWIHDYHFMLLPQFLREAGVNNRIGFFLHTPFPEAAFLRNLPYHREMLDSLARTDVLGFQTERDVARFMGAYREDNPLATIRAKVQAFPIGVDYAAHQNAAKSPQVRDMVDDIAKKVAGRRVIFSVSRLDYVKGIVTQLEGVERYLDGLPQKKREKILYKLVVSPSRENIAEYRALKREIQRTVRRINKRFGTSTWQPVDYVYKTYSFHEIVAWFQHTDVCLVAPWADGMNLVAKEYVAARQNNDGMVVLSRSVGAAFQLSNAVLVDPLDVSSIAEGLGQAFDMAGFERELRWEAMRANIRSEDIFWWVERFVTELTKPSLDMDRNTELHRPMGYTRLSAATSDSSKP